MNSDQKTELIAAAALLFNNLKMDIQNAGTRIEHIRLTTLAQEAENLYLRILSFVEDGPDL
jgi:hypothetical protein